MVAESTYKSLRFLGCNKGSRKCVYPKTRPNTKPISRSGRTGAPASGFSSGDYVKEEKDTGVESLERPPAINSNTKVASKMQRQSRTTSSNTNRTPISPSRDPTWPSAGQGLDQSKKFPSVSATVTSRKASPWFYLAPNLQYHLEYHQQLSHHHYFLGHDSSDFIHKILLEHAISYKPLLYAILGFAAFLEIQQQSKGTIQDFLGYYNMSVTLLRKSLSEGQEHTHSTLLTILQLATLEVTSELHPIRGLAESL